MNPQEPTPMRAVILFGHGSRDPLWRLPIEEASRRTQALLPGALVRCAYLELTEPDLPTVVAEVVAAGAHQLRVVPMFLGVGRHAREDLPALVDTLQKQHADVLIQLAPAVGEDPRLLQLLAEIACDAD
jgi:sirohydrochlorin cobaltochelatase